MATKEEIETRKEALRDASVTQATNESPKWLSAYGVPDRVVELLGQGTLDTPALDAIEAKHHVTVLSGSAGSGKTTAACEWLRRRLFEDVIHRIDGTHPGKSYMISWSADGAVTAPPAYKHPPLFLTAPKLARWPRYEEKEMDRLLKARFLVIDDLGVEYVDKNGSYLATLDEIVDTRYGEELPTVYTTNLAGADFKARYGERFADRIREAGRFINVSIPSLRKAS